MFQQLLILIFTLALLTISSGVKAKQTNPHKQQLSNPTELLELKVEEGSTKIIGASTIDLNAIHTPFDAPKIVQNVGEAFTISGRVIYFQPKEQKAFSVYITEKAVANAPIYKLTIAPSPVPVGLQVKLVPLDGYIPKSEKRAKRSGDGYPSTVIGHLSAAAKYLADKSGSGRVKLPQGFVKVEKWEAGSFYIGNSLVVPSQKLRSANFDLIMLEVQNRANTKVEYVHSDFSELPGDTGLLDKNDTVESFKVAGVTMYPKTKVDAGGTTTVIVLRGRN